MRQTADLEAIEVQLNSGGSNTLVRQVDLGAETDLLLLADDLAAKQFLLPKGYSLRPLASNNLVVVAPAVAAVEVGAPLERVLASASSLAVADPGAAPLGEYTKQALQGLKTKAKVVPLKDAQAVLSSVALGHVGLGIVYRSDALATEEVQWVCSIPAQRHQPVRYVAAIPPSAPSKTLELVNSLVEGQGRDVLKQHGFLPPADELSVSDGK